MVNQCSLITIKVYQIDKKPGDSKKKNWRKNHSPAIKPCHPVNSARTLGWNPFSDPFSIQIPALGNSHFSGRRPCKRGKLAASGVPFLGSRIMAPPPASWRSNRKKWRSDLGGDQVELTAWWLTNHLKTYESQGLSHILWKIKMFNL